MVDVLGAVLLLAGASLNLIAAIGIVRFPDLYARMHAATKPATLGMVLVLSGAATQVDRTTDIAKLVLVAGLQFLTNPVGAHMIGRASHRAGVPTAPRTVIDELTPVDAADARPPADG